MDASNAPILLTLKVASLATLVAALVGIPLARWVACSRNWLRDWIDAMLMLPLVLPPTVLGYYLIVVVGRNGPLGSWLENVFGVSLMFTWQGAVIAATLVALPLVYKAARAAFEEVSSSYEHAARLLGSGEIELFFRVTLPVASRGIVAGLMLTFARAMGEFGATLMIAGNLPGKTQTLSIAIYDAVQAGQEDYAIFLVGIISLLCVGVLLGSGRLLQVRY
ncbi:MAG: molybdate ABC transporter permease subunit [Betaproteobacteria bacterium]|nr:molybdate ABC transporter permease subunit [Betaproteobacteria bacterium]